MPVIYNLRDLTFDYPGNLPALRGINLTLQAGEKVAFLGSNGSGKSTLLKLLAGLYFAKSGLIEAFGEALSEKAFLDDDFNARFRRKVSLVFQDSDVQLFSPTVWDEIAFGPLQMGLGKAEVVRIVDEAMAALNVGKLRERAPHRLSGGEKKRVALASVLAVRPEVWLMDEPTAGLDPRSQSWLVDFIRQQAAQGGTFITATHDLDIVDMIADRVVVLNEDHQVEAVGAPEQILSNHALLLRCNLIHAHRHTHHHAPEGQAHEHEHLHPSVHAHEHSAAAW